MSAVPIWTLDRSLARINDRLNIGYQCP
jgi:hypothetical protein